MKPTPRQTQRFLFVFFNLLLGALAVLALVLLANIYLRRPPRNLFPPTSSLVFLFPIFLIVFANILMVRQVRRSKKYRAPECPACGSQDVSFGGEVAEITFQKSRSATVLTIVAGLGALVSTLAASDVVPRSWKLSPYIFAVPALSLTVQILSQALASRHRKRAREHSDGRVRWVCETCRNEWEALERAEEGVPAARASLIQ